MFSKTASRIEAAAEFWFETCLVVALMVSFAFGLIMVIIDLFAAAWPEVYVSSATLSSLNVSSSARQLNGTWHIDFSLPYEAPMGGSFSGDSAMVSLYYKGKLLAGTNLHAFRVTSKHPMQLKVNLGVSRSNVPGWLVDNLTEDRRLGAIEFDVQFVPKSGRDSGTYLCDSLRLGFSTAEEAKLIGDGHVRCPWIA